MRWSLLDVALTESFGIAGGAHEVARNVLVEVELADGTVGRGEAAPLPTFNGETQARVLAVLPNARAALLGQSAGRFRALCPLIGEATASVSAARCAVETAVLDALLRSHRLSAWSYFGGAEETLTSDVTIPTGTVARVREVLPRRLAQGFSTIKIKVGGGDLDGDIERICAIADLAPRVAIIADANAGLTEADALALVRGLRRRGVRLALFEQPVAGDDLDGLVAVSREPGVLVAADESASSLRAVVELVRREAVGVINLKLMKTGVDEALGIARVAAAAGMALMIGGMVESSLAIGMSAAFAAGLGGFRFVDLDTPLFFTADPFVGGYTMAGATLCLDRAAEGHGVSLRSARIAAGEPSG